MTLLRASFAALLSTTLFSSTVWAQAAEPATSSARTDVEGVIAAMVAAVLDGDPDGYLAHVWKDDPAWATEQKNWAADLTRKVPAEFEFLTGDLTPVGEDWLEGRVTMRWSFTSAKARTQHFVARWFRDPALGWLYAGEKWNVLEEQGVRVLYDDGMEGAARIVADELPAVRTHVLEGFGLLGQPIESRVQEVKIYSSMQHLQHSIYLSYTDGLGGWNEPHEAIKLLDSGLRRATGARTLLAHEYGHVATFELGDKASAMPWWALEGVAELSAEKFRGGRRPDGTIRRWMTEDRIIDWSRLADFHGEATKFYSQVYAQGHHMLGFITDTFGRPRCNDWLAAMARGATLDEATRTVLEVSFEELDARWRAAVKGKDTEPSGAG